MLTRQELLNMKKIPTAIKFRGKYQLFTYVKKLPAPGAKKFMENINYLLLLFRSLCQVYQLLELKYESHLPGKKCIWAL